MTTEEIMEQAQVFASAWSLVGSSFDSGNEIDNANEQKECLKQMLDALTVERDEYAKAADTQAASHKAERDELTSANSDLVYQFDAIREDYIRLKSDAERYIWMSALIVSGDFEILEKAFGTLDPKAETVTQADFDGMIDAAISALNQPLISPYAR